jgi:hypothetical protein
MVVYHTIMVVYHKGEGRRTESSATGAAIERPRLAGAALRGLYLETR